MANSSKFRMAVLMTWTAGRTVIPMLMALLLFGSRTRISDFFVSVPFYTVSQQKYYFKKQLPPQLPATPLMSLITLATGRSLALDSNRCSSRAVSNTTLSKDAQTVPEPNRHFLGPSACFSSFQNNFTVFFFCTDAAGAEDGGGGAKPPSGGGGGGGGGAKPPGGGGGGGGVRPVEGGGRAEKQEEEDESKVSMSNTSMSSSSSRSEKSRSLIRRAAALGCNWSHASAGPPGPRGIIWVFSRREAWLSTSMLLCCRR